TSGNRTRPPPDRQQPLKIFSNTDNCAIFNLINYEFKYMIHSHIESDEKVTRECHCEAQKRLWQSQRYSF
ncbi:MAG: hypothetical protein C4541_05020, partial [Candidatus Auribacter fodinae]